jgi:hypothetical protein
MRRTRRGRRNKEWSRGQMLQEELWRLFWPRLLDSRMTYTYEMASDRLRGLVDNRAGCTSRMSYMSYVISDRQFCRLVWHRF